MTHYEPDHHETDTERADREHDERLEARDKHGAHGPRCRTVGCDWPARTGDFCAQHAVLPDTEPCPRVSGTGSLRVTDIRNVSGDAAAVWNYTEAFTVPPEYAALENALDEATVLPRDLDDYPGARARVEAFAEQYASVEVDRLPPMGALHWLVRAHRADGGVDVFRVGVNGSLMPWGGR